MFVNFISEFDLEKERSVLDEQGLKIAENQENSQKNRRKLAESTRGLHIVCTLYIILVTSLLLLTKWEISEM